MGNGRAYLADNPNVVNQIVDRDLCVRCGACEPACPVDIIRFDDAALPYVTDEEKCPQACQRCLKVCPGEDLDLRRLDEESYGVVPHPESITGVVREAFVAFATDDRMRRTGASGGFVTQLLAYMLEKRFIDGALVLGPVEDGGGVRFEPMIARSVDDLRRAASSKYMAVPALRSLREIEEVEGRYAVVALPCFAHAIRKYQKSSKKLRERIALVIGLYCNVIFEPKVFDDLFAFSGIDHRQVVDVSFRDGNWPGAMAATLRDGSKVGMLDFPEFRDGFNLLKLFYTPPRCNMCTDYSAEYADIAVGDPWLRGPDGRFLFEDGRSTVLVRSSAGQEIVRRAAADDAVVLTPIPIKTFMVNFEMHASYKREFVPANLRLREWLGLPVPRYGKSMGRRKRGILLTVLVKNAVLWMSRFRWFRRLGVTLAQTPPATAYFRWNGERKGQRFVRSYARMSAFADRVALPDATVAESVGPAAGPPE